MKSFIIKSNKSRNQRVMPKYLAITLLLLLVLIIYHFLVKCSKNNAITKILLKQVCIIMMQAYPVLCVAGDKSYYDAQFNCNCVLLRAEYEWSSS